MSDVSAKAVITGEIYPTLLILLRFVKYLQRKQHSFVPDLPKASFYVNYKSVFQARQTLMLCKCGRIIIWVCVPFFSSKVYNVNVFVASQSHSVILAPFSFFKTSLLYTVKSDFEQIILLSLKHDVIKFYHLMDIFSK